MTIVEQIVGWLNYSLAFYRKWLKSILAFTQGQRARRPEVSELCFSSYSNGRWQSHRWFPWIAHAVARRGSGRVQTRLYLTLSIYQRGKEIRLHEMFTLSFPIWYYRRFGVTHYLISVCTAQYAESGLISIMRFVEIWTVFVLRLSFAVSKTDEILSLSTGDQKAWWTICSANINLISPRRFPRKKQHSNSLIIRAGSQWSARIWRTGQGL